jgi:tetratricopeptide (TPR) repeat protein
MAAMFYLAAVIAYLQARMQQEKQGRILSAGAVGWGAACLVASLCAINAKEIAYTLPLAIVLAEGLCFPLSRRKVVVVGTLISAALAIILVKLGLGKVPFEQAMFAMDEATRLQTITSRSDYLFTQFRVILTYIRLLFLPVNQSVDYDYTLSHGFFEPAVVGSCAILVLLLAVAVVLIRKSRSGDASLRLMGFGILWFFLALSVESSILPIIDLIFEHRVYLPSVGAIAAVTTAGLSYAWKMDRERYRAAACLVLLLIAVLLAGAAWKRNLVWKTEVTLWEDATSKKPNSSRAWNNLGSAYIKERSADKALKALVRSIELDRSKAEAWNNLGLAIDLKGVYRDRFNRTAEMFKTPQSVNERNLNRWQGDVNNNLGLAYEILGNYPRAVENYRNAIGYNPALGLAYYNLGLLSAAMGDTDSFAEQQQVLWMVDPLLAERLRQRVGGR